MNHCCFFLVRLSDVVFAVMSVWLYLNSKQCDALYNWQWKKKRKKRENRRFSFFRWTCAHEKRTTSSRLTKRNERKRFYADINQKEENRQECLIQTRRFSKRLKHRKQDSCWCLLSSWTRVQILMSIPSRLRNDQSIESIFLLRSIMNPAKPNKDKESPGGNSSSQVTFVSRNSLKKVRIEQWSFFSINV